MQGISGLTGKLFAFYMVFGLYFCAWSC